MKGITWSRDSHGLFDYESRHLTKRTMKTQNPVQIIRQQNELELVALEQARQTPITNPDTKPLLNIVNENGKSQNSKSTFRSPFLIPSKNIF